MRQTTFPPTLYYSDWLITLEQHTRGGPSEARHYSYEIGRGARWVGQIVTVPSSVKDGLTHRAWLHSLRGRNGSFYFTLPRANRAVAGSAVGATSAAVSENATSLTVSGPANPGAIVVGAFATVVTALGKQLVQIESVTGWPSPTVTFKPALRSEAAAGAAVEVGSCIGEFRLAGQTPKIPFRLDRAESFTLDFEEMY